MHMNTSTKKNLLLAAVAILIGLVGWGAWTLTRPNGPGEGFVSGNGRIEATEIDAATKYPGRVVDIFAQEGDFVTTGQVLAQMQIDVLNAQRDEARAQQQQAINAVASAEAQVKVRESDLAVAQAVAVQRDSDLDNAKRRLARSQTLSREGAASIQQLDDDQAAVRNAEAALAAAKAQVTAAQSAIAAAKAQVTGARSTVAALAATIARIEADIADSQLKAPRDGRVQYRVAQPGEVLGAGGKVLNMIDLSDVYMTFFLPETVAGRVALGSEVRIVLDAAPSYVIPARVSFVSSVAQFTPKTVETAVERQKLMFRVKARIDPELLKKHLKQVKTGLPGVAWLKLDAQAEWPEHLTVKVPE
ncbi:HlyD family secretion protein [Thauera humireducens]|uniref:HlyD family secretion protein n=1 Tax=Thauera humireducens TaxID=1134435 RepID=UPI0024A8D1BF|nr:HlyD family efflux transporter periplasmic adaptor subunit [Thauera humireducens]MDY0073881.1 HlyD family efflux transporter periplasmic adaptor subunit [Thauera sp.]